MKTARKRDSIEALAVRAVNLGMSREAFMHGAKEQFIVEMYDAYTKAEMVARKKKTQCRV